MRKKRLLFEERKVVLNPPGIKTKIPAIKAETKNHIMQWLSTGKVRNKKIDSISKAAKELGVAVSDIIHIKKNLMHETYRSGGKLGEWEFIYDIQRQYIDLYNAEDFAKKKLNLDNDVDLDVQVKQDFKIQYELHHDLRYWGVKDVSVSIKRVSGIIYVDWLEDGENKYDEIDFDTNEMDLVHFDRQKGEENKWLIKTELPEGCSPENPTYLEIDFAKKEIMVSFVENFQYESGGELKKDEPKKDFITELKEAIQDVFPNSAVNVSFRKDFLPSITIKFTIGIGKDEYKNGIIQNDAMFTLIHIFGVDESGNPTPNMSVESSSGFFYIKSTNPMLAYERIKTGWRNFKASDKETVIRKIKNYFINAKTLLIENIEKLDDYTKELVKRKYLAAGGEIEVTSDGSKGGLFVGPSHNEGGIPTKVKETGEMIEVEGGEPLIVPEAMKIKDKYRCVGKPKSIASAINQIGGGANFSEEQAHCELIEKKPKGKEMRQELKKITHISGKVVTAPAGAAVINKRITALNKEMICEGTPGGIASAINEAEGYGVKFSDEGKCEIIHDKKSKHISKGQYYGGGEIRNLVHASLIENGFINEDLSLTNKGKRIVELHKFCFPLKLHPFSHIYSTPSDIYDTFQYVNMDGTVMFTGGDNRIFEVGSNLDNTAKNNAEHNKDLEVQIKITKQDLTEYKPYSYCLGERNSAGFIVFFNYVNSNELYVRTELYNYAIKNYDITHWKSDSKNAVLLYGYKDNEIKVILRVEEQVVGLFDQFGLWDKDAVMSRIREKYPIYYSGKSISDFSVSKIDEKRQAAIKGIELLISLSDNEEEKLKYQQELEKLKHG